MAAGDLHGPDRRLDEALWSGLRAYAPAVAPSEAPVVEVDWDRFGAPVYGSDAPQRIAVWRPVPAGDRWACPVDVAGATGGPRAIPGLGPVDALLGATRVVLFATRAWFGTPHLAAGYVAPPDDRTHVTVPPPKPALRDPIAADRWRLDGQQLVDLAVGDHERLSASPLPYGTYACWVSLGAGAEVRARMSAGPLQALADASHRATQSLHRSARVERADLPGALLSEPYRALTRAIWSGVAPFSGGPLGEEAMSQVLWPETRVGRTVQRRFAVGRPVQREGGWVCPVDLQGGTSGVVAVPADGPVGALVLAMRLVDLAFSVWDPADLPDVAVGVPEDGADTGEVHPTEGPFVADVLRVDGHDYPISVGWPGPHPDHEQEWICAVRIDGWLERELVVHGVGPVDTLRNAARVMAGFFHTVA